MIFILIRDAPSLGDAYWQYEMPSLPNGPQVRQYTAPSLRACGGVGYNFIWGKWWRRLWDGEISHRRRHHCRHHQGRRKARIIESGAPGPWGDPSAQSMSGGLPLLAAILATASYIASEIATAPKDEREKEQTQHIGSFRSRQLNL